MEWVNTKQISIYFDIEPEIDIRYITPSTPKDEIKSIEKYPFINKKNFIINIEDKRKNKKYTFKVYDGYIYDGLTIPRIFWTLIGVSKLDNRGILGSCIHDNMCERPYIIDYDRKLSSIILRELLISQGLNKIKAYIMSSFVDIYQYIFCYKKWHI